MRVFLVFVDFVFFVPLRKLSNIIISTTSCTHFSPSSLAHTDTIDSFQAKLRWIQNVYTQTHSVWSRHSVFIHRPCYLFLTPTTHHHHFSPLSLYTQRERKRITLIQNSTPSKYNVHHCLYTHKFLSRSLSLSFSPAYIFERTRSYNLILVFSPQNRNLRHWQNFSSLCLTRSLARSSDLHAHAYTLVLIQLEEH